jgi:hypothetical protein
LQQLAPFSGKGTDEKSSAEKPMMRLKDDRYETILDLPKLRLACRAS